MEYPRTGTRKRKAFPPELPEERAFPFIRNVFRPFEFRPVLSVNMMAEFVIESVRKRQVAKKREVTHPIQIFLLNLVHIQANAGGRRSIRARVPAQSSSERDLSSA